MAKSVTIIAKEYFSQTQIEQFTQFLFSISNPDYVVSEENFKQLESIYTNGEYKKTYHHYYNNIYNALSQITKTDNLSTEYLISNLNQIKETYTTVKFDIHEEIEKLYDHTNLEVARFNDTLLFQHETSRLISNLNFKTGESITQLNSKSEEIKKKLNKTKIDYITILGIFSSIILAFVGSLVFSTSVLENINSNSVYRLVFTSGVIGLVFFNIIFTLLQFISKMIEKEISWIPFIVFNSIFVLILILTPVIYWHNNKSPEPVPQVINIFEQVQDK